jgi:hypothetical protein
MSFNLKTFAEENDKTKAIKSWAWYQTNVRNIAAASGIGPMKFLGENLKNQKSGIQPGQLIQYMYDPKTKADLPYYDTFPLVLPFAASATHFTGLNLHYIPPKIRGQLLNKLKSYITDDTLGPNAKMRVTWSLLKNVSAFPEVSPCVKQYLFSHVKSRFIIIPPKEWEYAVWLPLERFKKASNETVWTNWRNK